MTNLQLKNISKEFNKIKVLSDINIEVKQGEFYSIVGPSGCGKTTLLRIIAGLEFADTGNVIIKNIDSTELSPQKRNVGIVFQNYALFPNMTVFENVAYGLEIKKENKNFGKDIIKEKVNLVLEKVQMSHKINNNVTTLSGGEQQRISLARVIVTEPDVILFDEPLSNLDYALRLETRNELKRLQREVGITSVYVTHDQTEALALSDRIAVLNKGIVQQTGTPYEVYYNPDNSFVAEFIGHSNLFDAALSKEIFNVGINNDERLSVLPEELIPVANTDNKIAKITDVQFTGFSIEYSISVKDLLVKALQPTHSVNEKFNVGDEVGLKLLSDKIRKVK
ncbi:MAG: ABC transporter ATP-binding protein [Ignavibacteria bacterium]|nr:ABC transporter ATP-binding protein [Ignavibacteria bacterium]